MEKKNTLFLTIIAIATLLVAVVGATFAYFASNIDTNSNIAVNVNTSANTATFVATAGKEISISVDSFEMQESDAGDGSTQSTNTDYANGLTDNSTLNVTLLASDENKTTTCSYDVIFTWADDVNNGFSDSSSSSRKNYYPSKYYARTDTNDTSGFKELTIEGNINVGVEGMEEESPGEYEEISETNIDEFKPQESSADKKVLVLKSGQTISSISTKNKSYHNYTFTVKFYNLKDKQDTLMGKTFAGTISVANVKC